MLAPEMSCEPSSFSLTNSGIKKTFFSEAQRVLPRCMQRRSPKANTQSMYLSLPGGNGIFLTLFVLGCGHSMAGRPCSKFHLNPE